MRKKLHVLGLFVFFISGLFFIPVTGTDNGSTMISDLVETTMTESEYVPRDIRVAIYDESNITPPNYQDYAGIPHNNATGLRDVLEEYGYQVTLLDVNDIYNYELTTADYDVFCLIDNQPREKIVYRIMDFWLGGGGILSFDGSAGFLCSFGILPPESEGTGSYGTYWGYFSNNISIIERHPIAKEYPLDYLIDLPLGTFAWNYTALQSTSIADDIVMVGKSPVWGERAPLLAFDPSDRGGRVVTIGTDLYTEYIADLEPIYRDSIDWLAPRPKARILYDLSHSPWCPTDPWEPQGQPNYLTTWRDNLVAREFTVDKLHPSAEGNFTSENLAPYDMLVTNQPLLNFTSQEAQAVMQWVENGGGLFAVGDNPNVPDNHHLNALIYPYGIQFNHTVSAFDETFTLDEMHPTTEACNSLAYHGATSLILTDDAYPVWYYASNDVAVGAAEYGDGRVIVICDANSVLDSNIAEEDNLQFSVNVANWLTSAAARVLVYHDYPAVGYNYYTSAIALALNDLGLDFMLTSRAPYFNLSMNSKDWDLIISDANSVSPLPLHSYLIDHLENGGKLIMRDLYFYEPDYALWHYLGFEGRGSTERITNGPPPVYLWDQYNWIFNRPVDYGEDYIDSTVDYYFTDWTSVYLFDNTTALAGLTPTSTENESAIIESVNGQAICNLFSISQYYDDTDDSTYADNYELWLNEIAYMMRPTIESPGDLEFEIQGETLEFDWVAHSYAPGDYQVTRDGLPIFNNWWYGSPITVDVSGLAVGIYEYGLMVRDHVGYRTDDVINVTIVDHIAPDWIVSPSDAELDYGESFSQQISASDPSGIGGWYVDDNDNFAITQDGLLSNNTVLDIGTYQLSVSVEDTFANIRHHIIYVTVNPLAISTSETPTESTTTTPSSSGGDSTLLIIIIIIAGSAVIIIIIIIMKKKGG